MSSDLHVVAMFTLKPGTTEQFLAGVKQITQKVQETEPGALRYFAFQSKTADGKDQVVFVEKYTSQQALQAHREMAHYKSFAAVVPQCLDGPPEVKFGPLISGFEGR